jgi:hypothetical protein
MKRSLFLRHPKLILGLAIFVFQVGLFARYKYFPVRECSWNIGGEQINARCWYKPSKVALIPFVGFAWLTNKNGFNVEYQFRNVSVWGFVEHAELAPFSEIRAEEANGKIVLRADDEIVACWTISK